jgi:hypothetical protein
MVAAVGVHVERGRMAYLAWQAKQRFGKHHPLTVAADKASITMESADIAHAIELLDMMEGLARKHIRCVFYGNS